MNGKSCIVCAVQPLRYEIQERFPVPDDQAARIRRRRREDLERIYTEIRVAERKK